MTEDITPDRAAALLVSAADRLEAAGRSVSAYSLLKEAADLAPLSPQAARRAINAAIRFQDAPLAASLLSRIRAEGRTARRWVKEAAARLAHERPFDARRAEALLAHRASPRGEIAGARLCYAVSSSPPQVSGYSTRTHGIAAGLMRAGIDVVGLTRPGYPADRGTPDRPAGAPLVEVGGVVYHRIARPMRDTLARTAYVDAAIPAYEQAIAALHPAAVLAASNWESALPAGAAARRLGLPFLYEVRGFWEMSRIPHEPGFDTTPLYAAWAELEAVTARGADHVFTLTQPMREELVRRGVPDARITVLPNGCDPTEFAPLGKDLALAQHLGLPDGVPIIGYVGSFVNFEGLELLVDACAALAGEGLDFRLLLVGSEAGGPGTFSSDLRARAAGQGLASRLVMPGRVPHDAVRGYYSLIDICPFPRLSHAVTETVSPLKPMEAMAMSKAVIVSDVRAMAEMVQDGATGLVVTSGDRAALAAALRRLLNNPDLRRSLGLRARDFIIEARDWRRICETAKTRIVDVIAAQTGEG